MVRYMGCNFTVYSYYIKLENNQKLLSENLSNTKLSPQVLKNTKNLFLKTSKLKSKNSLTDQL